MSYQPVKEIKHKERQDKMLKQQLEKDRETQIISEIEKTEKERIKKKGLKTLKNSGILDSYQCKYQYSNNNFLLSDLLTSLCKYGLPTGDLYEFSALQVLRYEKKLKAQKKKELEDRLKKREEQKKASLIAAKSPPKKTKKEPKPIVDDATKPVEPNYDEVRITEEQQAAVATVIEEQWLDPSEKYNFEQCQEMIKAMNPEIQAFEEEAFNMIFTENSTKNEDQMVAKDDMQTYSMNYLLHFERARLRSEYEAAVKLHEMQK